MKYSYLLLPLLLLILFTTPGLADSAEEEAVENLKDLTAEDRKILEMMEMLEILELLDNMEDVAALEDN